jgi:hypothetical protein
LGSGSRARKRLKQEGNSADDKKTNLVLCSGTERTFNPQAQVQNAAPNTILGLYLKICSTEDECSFGEFY